MRRFLFGLGSARLAVALLAMLALVASLGALYPQETRTATHALTAWQSEHPFASGVGAALGFFHIFHSPLFLAVVGLLLVNTLVCTIRTALAWSIPFSRERRVRNTGFLVLHIGLLILGAGGLISAGFRLDGFVILIEGQAFKESPASYNRLFESPFRGGTHLGYSLQLESVTVELNAGEETMVTSRLQLKMDEDASLVPIETAVNRPAAFEGVYLTQDRTGYAPFIRIMNRVTGQPLAAGYVALQRFDTPQGRLHRDQLKLPMGNVLTVTFHPSANAEQEPNRLTIDLARKDELVGTVNIDEGQSTRFDRFIVFFDNTRRWSAFRIMEDPGYPVVLWGLWIALAGFVLRYLQDIIDWLISGEPVSAAESTGEADGTG